MAKYKIKHTSIMHNDKVYGEGSEIELTEKEAARLSDFIEKIPVKTEAKPKPQTAKTQAKTKAETKTAVTEKSEKTAETDGGTKVDE